jgi:hypothetical protein
MMAIPRGMPIPRPSLATVLRPETVEIGDGLAVAEGGAVDAPVGIAVGEDVVVFEDEVEIEVALVLELVVDVDEATIPIVVNAFKSPVKVVVFDPVLQSQPT